MRWQYWVVLVFHVLLIVATYNLYQSLQHRERDPASIDTSRLHQALQRQNAFKLATDVGSPGGAGELITSTPSPPLVETTQTAHRAALPSPHALPSDQGGLFTCLYFVVYAL